MKWATPALVVAMALPGACECRPRAHYDPPPPSDLLPAAYVDAAAPNVVEDWPAAPRVGIAGARLAVGGLYLDVIVESDEPDPGWAARESTAVWTAASRLSRQTTFGPPYGDDDAVLLRIADASSAVIDLRMSSFRVAHSPFCLWHGCVLFQHEWVSVLESGAGTRLAATLCLRSSAPIAPGAATILPPPPPRYDEPNAVHRLLAIPPEGAPIEVRETDWMATPVR